MIFKIPLSAQSLYYVLKKETGGRLIMPLEQSLDATSELRFVEPSRQRRLLLGATEHHFSSVTFVEPSAPMYTARSLTMLSVRFMPRCGMSIASTSASPARKVLMPLAP